MSTVSARTAAALAPAGRSRVPGACRERCACRAGSVAPAHAASPTAAATDHSSPATVPRLEANASRREARGARAGRDRQMLPARPARENTKPGQPPRGHRPPAPSTRHRTAHRPATARRRPPPPPGGPSALPTDRAGRSRPARGATPSRRQGARPVATHAWAGQAAAQIIVEIGAIEIPSRMRRADRRPAGDPEVCWGSTCGAEAGDDHHHVQGHRRDHPDARVSRRLGGAGGGARGAGHARDPRKPAAGSANEPRVNIYLVQVIPDPDDAVQRPADAG